MNDVVTDPTVPENTGEVVKQINDEFRKLAVHMLETLNRAHLIDALPESQCFSMEAELGSFRYILTLSRVPLHKGRVEALTARESEVAELAVKGFTNKTIAAKLKLRRSTVAAHLRSIYSKRSVPSRVALALHMLGMPAPERAARFPAPNSHSQLES